MESRVGWNRAVLAAKNFDVYVLYGADFDENELHHLADGCHVPNRLKFIRVHHSQMGSRWIESPFWFYSVYAAWQRRAFTRAIALHKEIGFDLAHQVNFCGYREPGHGHKLNIPFVWGPVGGTANFNLRFLPCTDLLGGTRELIRNAINIFQLKFSSRVREAAKNSAKIFVANSSGQSDFKKYIGVDSEVLLEIGIDKIAATPKPLRSNSDPLKILWAGRLRTWKCLPLLLQSLAKLPADVPFQLRILGVGDCQQRWKRLAERLRISDRIEWLGWPNYDETLPHYAWADVFAFTSLRDTSGTGILESLAAGTPIVGLDHQGLADIIDKTCGIPIPVTDPEEVCRNFCVAFSQLSSSPELLHDLGRGALVRASDYLWKNLDRKMQATYASLVSVHSQKTVIRH